MKLGWILLASLTPAPTPGCTGEAPVQSLVMSAPSPFAPVDEADLSQELAERLEALESQRTTLSVELVRFDPSAFLEQETLRFEATTEAGPLLCRKLEYSGPDEGRPWTGEFVDGLGEVVLSVAEGECTGYIRRNGTLVLVRPLGGGFHALILQDEEQAPPDHPADSTSPPLGESTEEGDEPIGVDTSDGASPVIALLVAYTPAVAKVVPNVRGLAMASALTTNRTFENSGLAVRVTIVGLLAVDYKETAHELDVKRLAEPGDGFMDSVHAERDRLGADAVILLVDNEAACGWSAAVKAAAASSFAVVHHACADGRLSFPHELGHLIGASHNPEANPQHVPFAWGHGYRMGGLGWRTIMAYGGGTKCQRIPYWSSPKTFMGGVPLGTLDRHDNARVIHDRAGEVARFRK